MKKTTASPGVDTDHDKSVGERIRYWRERRGLNRRQLGELLKTREGNPVTEQQIYRWEDGRDTPQSWRWQELANALGVSPGAIFGEPENPQLLVRLDLAERKVDAIVRVLGIAEAVEAAVSAERRSAGDSKPAEGSEAERVARAAAQEAETEDSGLEQELDADDSLRDSSERPDAESEPGSENQ